MKACPFCGKKEPVRFVHSSEMCEEDAHGDSWAVCCDATQDGCGSCSGYKETKEKTEELWDKAKR